MKSERILNSLGNVEEKYIEEAAPTAPVQEIIETDPVQKSAGTALVQEITETDSTRKAKKPVRATKRLIWMKWGTLAACLVITVCVGMQFAWKKQSDGDPDESLSRSGGNSSDSPAITEGGFTTGIIGETQEGNSNLPMLKVTGDPNAAGFEGYMAYDISELVNDNPWSKDLELSALPVYRNRISYDESFIGSGADFEEMRRFLAEIASRLGMEAETLMIWDNSPTPEQQAIILEKAGGDLPEGYFNPTAVLTEKDGIKIEVDTTMTATVTFEPARVLPDGYNFTHYASYEDARAVAGYLQDTYENLMGKGNFKTDIRGGAYNIYGQQSYEIGFYGTSELLEESGSMADDSAAEEIVNYNFRRIRFYCNEEGKLYMIRLYYTDLSNKVGEYPIISPEEAERLLLKGNYITMVPYEVPGQDYVAEVELIYRTGKYEEYYMPYYRFYVEVPDLEREGGMKDYGAYYVPAVPPEYISNMPQS